jgi:hypothetical protein
MVRFISGEYKTNFQKVCKALNIVSSTSMPKGMHIEQLSAKPDSFIKGLNIPISFMVREEGDGEIAERRRPLLVRDWPKCKRVTLMRNALVQGIEVTIALIHCVESNTKVAQRKGPTWMSSWESKRITKIQNALFQGTEVTIAPMEYPESITKIDQR